MNFKLETKYKEDRDRFVHYNSNNKVDAEVDFTPDDTQKTYTIDSTVVDPSLRGQGIAGNLMVAMAKHARETGYRIINVCPYAVNYFDKHHDQYADILK